MNVLLGVLCWIVASLLMSQFLLKRVPLKSRGVNARRKQILPSNLLKSHPQEMKEDLLQSGKLMGESLLIVVKIFTRLFGLLFLSPMLVLYMIPAFKKQDKISFEQESKR